MDSLGLGEFAAGIPVFERAGGRYRAMFARTPEQVEAALRLRYEVFNLELGEGLDESSATGLDRDRFDGQCHHLLVEDVPSARIVGTYRLQVEEMARRGDGFYTDQEYDLTGHPEVWGQAVEIGRACIAREHRHGFVLLLLWQGLGEYARHHDKRYFFGCCSITSQDPTEGARVFEYLRQYDHLHPRFLVPARPGWECLEGELSSAGWESERLPALFRTYLRYGARICSVPALDREFKTIDYLALLDLEELNAEKILSQFAEFVRQSS